MGADRVSSEAMISRSVKVQNHILDLQLECRFWECLDEIMERDGTTLQGLVVELRSTCSEQITSDLRVIVLQHYQCEPDTCGTVTESSPSQTKH